MSGAKVFPGKIAGTVISGVDLSSSTTSNSGTLIRFKLPNAVSYHIFGIASIYLYFNTGTRATKYKIQMHTSSYRMMNSTARDTYMDLTSDKRIRTCIAFATLVEESVSFIDVDVELNGTATGYDANTGVYAYIFC